MKLGIQELGAAYQGSTLRPVDVVTELQARIAGRGEDGVWISRTDDASLLRAAEAVEETAKAGSSPLAGVPFAIKDNLDLKGLPTTAACPDFSYLPERSATVVDRLLSAGALPLGKTNMDQFATGLVGVRTPYGVARNPHGANYIPGGSSSGSAVAVAAGLCSFALGTDTAGSGRVPAAFNNLVGLKPTRGLLSTTGLLPACRSLDCVSIFTRSVGDAATVFASAAAFDASDPYSREASPPASFPSAQPRIGVPRGSQLEFFGDENARRLYLGAVARWQQLGAVLVEVNIQPLLDAARLLYDGPWVAERFAAIRAFLQAKPESLHPVTRRIIEPAANLRAVDAFDAFYRLAASKAASERLFSGIDALLLPTAPTVYTIEQVLADPLGTNSRLGYYTNFMNLLDLCGLALPAGVLDNGIPWGVTLAAPAFHDDRLLGLGARYLGETPPPRALQPKGPYFELAVCGAHLSGLPLNWQLSTLGGRLKRRAKTAPEYRLHALPGTVPAKPGLARVGTDGCSIDLEVWELPVEGFGYFVAQIPAPLGIGRIKLEGGEWVQGFLCESAALEGALDVSHHGGWRNYLAAIKP